MTLTQDLSGPPQSCQAARQFKSNIELYGDTHVQCKHREGVIFPLHDMAHGQCCCFQTTGAWHFFQRLKSNAGITLSLQQKSIPEMLHKMHQQAQPDKGVTRLHSQMLLIHPSHAWSLRLEIIHLPGKERNKNILRHQATEMLHKHYCFCNIYQGCLSRLWFFSWDPASWVVKDRPWNTIQVLKDS